MIHDLLQRKAHPLENNNEPSYLSYPFVGKFRYPRLSERWLNALLFRKVCLIHNIINIGKTSTKV